MKLRNRDKNNNDLANKLKTESKVVKKTVKKTKSLVALGQNTKAPKTTDRRNSVKLEIEDEQSFDSSAKTSRDDNNEIEQSTLNEKIEKSNNSDHIKAIKSPLKSKKGLTILLVFLTKC